MRRPRDSAHSGCGYGLEDDLVRNFTLVGGNRHSAVQDIESEPIRAADERPNGLPEDPNFFGTPCTLGTTGMERRRTKRTKGFQPNSLQNRTGKFFEGTGNLYARAANYIGVNRDTISRL